MPKTYSADYVRTLRAENEELLARIAILENVIRPEIMPPSEWNLSPGETRLFQVLSGEKVVGLQRLQIGCAKFGDDEPVSEETVRSLTSRMRQKIAPFGYRIHNHHGVGYELERSSGSIIRTKSELLRSDHKELVRNVIRAGASATFGDIVEFLLRRPGMGCDRDVLREAIIARRTGRIMDRDSFASTVKKNRRFLLQCGWHINSEMGPKARRIFLRQVTDEGGANNVRSPARSPVDDHVIP